ncbi:hypothetical protein FIV00_13705 [Labrenzia sp. THAF82]|nr:hypothetical protein FIV00_13705 [Labrenzia sp. THAF82]
MSESAHSGIKRLICNRAHLSRRLGQNQVTKGEALHSKERRAIGQSVSGTLKGCACKCRGDLLCERIYVGQVEIEWIFQALVNVIPLLIMPIFLQLQ